MSIFVHTDLYEYTVFSRYKWRYITNVQEKYRKEGSMLTDLKIKKLKASEDGKGKKYNDSSGLYLYVSPAGGKVFRFDYSFGGKRKTLTIGKYPIVSLGEARDAAFEARKS